MMIFNSFIIYNLLLSRVRNETMRITSKESEVNLKYIIDNNQP